jgi:hypothetical protein
MRKNVVDPAAKEVVQNHIQNGGRIFRRRQGRRIITVAWRRDGEKIRYGAVIYRQDPDAPNTYNRVGHNLTAINRLNEHCVSIPAPESVSHISQIDDYIRKAMLTLGCRSK